LPMARSRSVDWSSALGSDMAREGGVWSGFVEIRGGKPGEGVYSRWYICIICGGC
jgi:hypothetical protein